tara:strand:- start:8 stop:1588 length:1581 start_codon:yes stop_codon:yes gene_type:complete
MKIEEPNRLPYYSPTIFENDVEILIQPEASTLFSSYCDDTDVYYESVDCDSECDESVCIVEDNYFYNNIILSDLDGMPGVVIDDSQVPPTVIMPDYLLECYELAYLDDPNYENNWSEFFDGMRIRFDNALRLLPTDKQAALYDAYSYPDSSLVRDFFLASQQIGTGGFGGGSSNMAELELQFFNSFESKPTFNYEIEFSSSPLDTAIQKAPSSGCGADWNSTTKQTLLPFKVKNLTTGKYVKLSHTDKGIWNGISTDVPSWFSTPDDVTSHPGYGNCVWEPGELIQFVSDTVVVGDSELPTSESTFQLKLYYESDIISFATYICANGWGFSFDEFDPTSSYSSGDCIYNEGLIWYASNDVNANYGYSPGEWHDSNSDGVNDNLWDPIYLWHDYFAQNNIVLKPQKWYADGDFWITDMSMLGSPTNLTEETLSQVKVVPNPYVARSDFNESANGNRLRFTYLPQQCKISIYTISGELVDVINHDSTFDGNEWWDLKNSSGDDVAPGLYIYVVEASNLKEIGKFVIVR